MGLDILDILDIGMGNTIANEIVVSWQSIAIAWSDLSFASIANIANLDYLGTLAPFTIAAIGAVLLAEVVRDVYHYLEHQQQPMPSGHALHHKIYRPDLTCISLDAYKQAQWLNDVPEALVMIGLTGVVAIAAWLVGLSAAIYWGLSFGCLYSIGFLATAIARSQGYLIETDLTHKPGDLKTLPSNWFVNRTYHWRHHFDQGNAYYCSTVTMVDKILGSSLALKGKTIAITGASGTLGRALLAQLNQQGAKLVALTTSAGAEFDPALKNLKVLSWQPGAEADLLATLQTVDILIINHGINVYGDRDPLAIEKSYQVNTFSAWRLLELFLTTVTTSKHKATKEVWVNTSEAEVNPAFSPLYELSKRTLGDLITMRRLDAPCIIRKVILGPFKSNLNPVGVMSADFVAWGVVALAQRGFRNIIVTINPITLVAFPIKEFLQSLYFRLFTKTSSNPPQPGFMSGSGSNYPDPTAHIQSRSVLK
ncbi:fatty acid hydroxylase [Thalassoporum mexicanum PCC 7367]|uniref:bifunctional sterol desaturase/short chain dehydrogenase n=1 Tax=Thalassoporum mexicanum TaxID=3457544 RepID=UPI00029FB175|nr:bifunctional sterol desaturase/short chain dehydrogenase [Pseudanabaena sp. PCC 7367]AFY70429.1 fatty acid hydroxylase [Pseudanabaena sp. PCC 7367]